MFQGRLKPSLFNQVNYKHLEATAVLIWCDINKIEVNYSSASTKLILMCLLLTISRLTNSQIKAD